jgi:hypothetical protein
VTLNGGNSAPILSTFTLHFHAMYSEAMFTFAAAADKLEITIAEILDILDLTVEDAEVEDLTVDEIIEAVEDCCELDWIPGCDSISNHCESYPYN